MYGHDKLSPGGSDWTLTGKHKLSSCQPECSGLGLLSHSAALRTEALAIAASGSGPKTQTLTDRMLLMSQQHLRSPMLTFATTEGQLWKLSTGANGQKEDEASFFCPRSFD